jgi:Type II secretion system (T2SS), protein M
VTSRDRLVVMVIAVLVLLGGAWLVVVSPERSKASKLQEEVNTATSQLTGAQGQLANATAAQARYSSAYATIVSLGKAVPPGREQPSLLYELAQASNQRHVDLSSVSYQAPGGSASASSASAASAASVAGFTQMPFTFVFTGSFSDLYSLFQQLNHATARTANGGIQVSGRLLTIQSAKLAPINTAAGGSASSQSSVQLSGTISATAYVLPSAQGLTGGATPSSPAPASTGSSKAAGASAATTPALAKVIP